MSDDFDLDQQSIDEHRDAIRPYTRRVDHRTKPHVYIAGPYSSDLVAGVRAAISVARPIRAHGGHPVIPHLTMLWDFVDHQPREHWLAHDLETLAVCDILYRLPGESEGADGEVEYAVSHDIAVVYDIAGMQLAIGMGRFVL